jgi:hypothetical protein
MQPALLTQMMTTGGFSWCKFESLLWWLVVLCLMARFCQLNGFCDISVSYGSLSEDDFSSGILNHVVWWRFADVSEVLAAFIVAMLMEAGRTSETSVNFCQNK